MTKTRIKEPRTIRNSNLRHFAQLTIKKSLPLSLLIGVTLKKPLNPSLILLCVLVWVFHSVFRRLFQNCMENFQYESTISRTILNFENNSRTVSVLSWRQDKIPKNSSTVFLSRGNSVLQPVSAR